MFVVVVLNSHHDRRTDPSEGSRRTHALPEDHFFPGGNGTAAADERRPHSSTLPHRFSLGRYLRHVGVAVAGGVSLYSNSDPNPSEQELLGSVDVIVRVVFMVVNSR